MIKQIAEIALYYTVYFQTIDFVLNKQTITELMIKFAFIAGFSALGSFTRMQFSNDTDKQKANLPKIIMGGLIFSSLIFVLTIYGLHIKKTEIVMVILFISGAIGEIFMTRFFYSAEKNTDKLIDNFFDNLNQLVNAFFERLKSLFGKNEKDE